MQVFPITNAAGTGIPTLGAVIPTGRNIQSIAADRKSNIWIVGATITDIDMTTQVYVVNKGESTAAEVTGLTYATGFNLLSGMYAALPVLAMQDPSSQPCNTASSYLYVPNISSIGK